MLKNVAYRYVQYEATLYVLKEYRTKEAKGKCDGHILEGE